MSKKKKPHHDREVFAARDIPDDILLNIMEAEPPEWTKSLDYLCFEMLEKKDYTTH